MVLALPSKRIFTYFPLGEVCFPFAYKLSCISLLLSFTGLFEERISEHLLHSAPPVVHMVPVHQLSVAPGYSLSPALHTQPSSAAVLPAAVAGAISFPILRVLLQVPSDFSEPVNQLESKMFWRLAEPAHHHPPGTSGPAPWCSQPQMPVERRFTRPHLGAAGSVAPVLP